MLCFCGSGTPLTAAWEPVSLRPVGCTELGDTRQMTPQELTRHPCKGVGVKVSRNGFDLKPKACVVSTKQGRFRRENLQHGLIQTGMQEGSWRPLGSQGLISWD